MCYRAGDGGQGNLRFGAIDNGDLKNGEVGEVNNMCEAL